MSNVRMDMLNELQKNREREALEENIDRAAKNLEKQIDQIERQYIPHASFAVENKAIIKKFVENFWSDTVTGVIRNLEDSTLELGDIRYYQGMKAMANAVRTLANHPDDALRDFSKKLAEAKETLIGLSPTEA